VMVAVLAAGCGGSTTGGGDGVHLDASSPGVDAPVVTHVDAHVVIDTGLRGSTDAAADHTGTPDTGKADGAAQPDAPVPDAAPPTAPPPPQVGNLGGTVLASAKVQLIAYAEDPLAMDIQSFITELGSTTEWTTQTSQYGVGPFTQLPTILIPGTPPASLDDSSGNPTPFEQTLAANLTGASPAWGAADPTTEYVFLLPAGTNISSNGGGCCTEFLGYHYETPVGATNVSYAVVCDCAPVQGQNITALENTTTTVSHEMVEEATDSNPAFARADRNDIVWTYVTGGEIADMCEYNLDSNYLPPGSTYMIQRSWSNAAATAGTNPCVPVATTAPYFNSYVAYSDDIGISYYGYAVQTTGVKLAVGATRTVDVVLSSVAPTAGPWTVHAWDMNDYLGNPSNTTLSLDKTTGSNGDVLHLTITVNSYDPNFGGAGFIIESTLDGQDNLTMGAIGG
jgi:hypothetical protein